MREFLTEISLRRIGTGKSFTLLKLWLSKTVKGVYLIGSEKYNNNTMDLKRTSPENQSRRTQKTTTRMTRKIRLEQVKRKTSKTNGTKVSLEYIV